MDKRIKDILKNPFLLFLTLGHRGFFNWMDDETYLKIAYRIKMGKKLHLNPPVTYNEKLQWLKLYDRRPEYTTMVDKYEVKKWVAKQIGDKYIIPTLGVWDKFEDINFDKLPNQFVLKCTHDSGGLVICRDKSKFDIKSAKEKITSCLKHNYFWGLREWPYKNVKPRIIAEQYMEDSESKELRDYKFFTFNGVAKALFVATDRNSQKETKFNFFDAEFKRLPFINGHPNSDVKLNKPKTFKKMKKIADKLSQTIPQARVDFYEVNGKAYFGEITFFHWSGMVPFNPENWDEEFGKWIELPKKWGYSFVGEEFVLWIHQSDESVLTDYKFFCFNGIPKLMYISKDRSDVPTTDFFDINFKRLNMHMKDPNSSKKIEKPICFEEMKKCAAILSKGIPNIRVDFYVINNKPYIGELTFYHMSGFTHIYPKNWELTLGNWITLPNINK